MIGADRIEWKHFPEDFILRVHVDGQITSNTLGRLVKKMVLNPYHIKTFHQTVRSLRYKIH